MKFRSGHVSNSSSCSFIVYTDGDPKELVEFLQEVFKSDGAVNDISEYGLAKELRQYIQEAADNKEECITTLNRVLKGRKAPEVLSGHLVCVEGEDHSLWYQMMEYFESRKRFDILFSVIHG